MRADFSEKVDKFILSKMTKELLEEAKNVIIGNTDVVNDMINMADVKIPEAMNINTSVYLNSDRYQYSKCGDNARLLVLDHNPNATDVQKEEYKKFLAAYDKAWRAKVKYLIAVKLINIDTACQTGISGLFTLYNTVREYTFGAKLCRVVDGLNFYFLKDKMSEIIDLDMYIDESKENGDVDVTPITLDMLADKISKNNPLLVEGSYYQSGDDEAYYSVDPFVDGIDTPLVIEILIDSMQDNIVISGQYNIKARQNIENTLNQVNRYLQTLPLTTKSTEVDILNYYIRSMLNEHDRISDDKFDGYSINLIEVYRDIDPNLLFQDVVNISKCAAKYFKHNLVNGKLPPLTFFPNEAIAKAGIEILSGINPDRFVITSDNINKLSLATYIED